ADDALADAGKLRQPLRQHVAGGVVNLALGQRLRGYRQNQDGRVGRIDLTVGRVAPQRGRQVGARRINRCLDVAGRAVDVAVEVKLQRDTSLADAALRRHLADVGDLAEMALEWRGNAGGDRRWARTWKLRADRDRRKIDL